MAYTRIRITSDGKLKLKVHGRKGKVEEIPWRDRHRRRAIKTLSRLLKAMPEFEDLKEKPIERDFWVEYEEGGEIHRRRITIKDTVLSARLSPSTHLLRLYPGLNETSVTFEYMGGGWFTVLSKDGNGEVKKALNEAIRGFVQPLYSAAFSANLPDQQIREMIEAHYTKRLPMEKPEAPPVGEMPREGEPEASRLVSAQSMEGAPSPLPKMSESAPPAPPMGKASKEPRSPPAEERAEPEEEKVGGAISIEEMKKEIEGFHPQTFVERAAHERYLQAISRPWAKKKEEEVHEVFYRLITSKRRPQDFQRYYNQLRLLVPEWLETKRELHGRHHIQRS